MSKRDLRKRLLDSQQEKAKAQDQLKVAPEAEVATEEIEEVTDHTEVDQATNNNSNNNNDPGILPYQYIALDKVH